MPEVMDDRPRRRLRRHHLAAMLLLLAVIVAAPLWMRGDRSVPSAQNRTMVDLLPQGPGVTATPRRPDAPSLAPLALVPSPAPAPTEPFDIAHARIEEDRGQAMGLAARVTVPPQLQPYSDRRRFLAVQMADSRDEQYILPQDDADLVAMWRSGTLVEMPPLTGEYMLYDVGTDASDDPMAAYDANARKDIPLFASAAELDTERARLAQRARHAPSRRERAAADARGHFLSSYYDDPPKREELLRKGADVLALAADFGGPRYDLRDPRDRARFDARLLSLTRPATRGVILDLARSTTSASAAGCP